MAHLNEDLSGLKRIGSELPGYFRRSGLLQWPGSSWAKGTHSLPPGTTGPRVAGLAAAAPPSSEVLQVLGRQMPWTDATELQAERAGKRVIPSRSEFSKKEGSSYASTVSYRRACHRLGRFCIYLLGHLAGLYVVAPPG